MSSGEADLPGSVAVVVRTPRIIRAYAEAVTDLLRGTRNGGTTDRRLGYAVLDRAEELLAQFGAGTTARHSGILRVERARMALRLLRWLGEPDEPPESVAAGIRRQLAHWV